MENVVTKCKKCGSENYFNDTCTNCGASLNTDEDIEKVNIEEKKIADDTKKGANIKVAETDADKKEATKLAIASLVLFFGEPAVGAIINLLPENISAKLSTLVIIGPLAGIITMVVGRIKYPTNTLLKIVMLVLILSTIIGITAMIWFIIACVSVCTSLP